MGDGIINKYALIINGRHNDPTYKASVQSARQLLETKGYACAIVDNYDTSQQEMMVVI